MLALSESIGVLINAFTQVSGHGRFVIGSGIDASRIVGIKVAGDKVDALGCLGG